MNKKVNKLLEQHQKLVHTEAIKVVSHVQREQDDWMINTLMLENVSAPFKYKRKKRYKTLVGQRVNLTYYPDIETVAGFEIDVMNIVRIKIA
ncbi:hypothetical protein [Thalassotalea atypica]|uniref:hypothetical protein n=1 Tax=Thalassotalea atypica TaxID=2054316 RepID=UPI0025728104|nr:hypothetical protein [Thalassotalea atypica]